MKFQKKWTAFLLTGFLALPHTGILNAEELTSIAEDDIEFSYSVLAFVGDGEVVNGDEYVTRSESWSGKTVKGNVYLYEGAYLSLYGNTVIEGDFYVLGMVYANGPLTVKGTLKCLYCSLDPGAVTSSNGHVYILSESHIEGLDHSNTWVSEMPPDPRVTPTPRPTATPTPRPTSTPTPRPTSTPTPTPTPEATPTPTYIPIVPNIRETLVNGLEDPLVLSPGASYSFEVIGAGTNNTNPGEGDVCWKPAYWKTSLSEGSARFSRWSISTSAGITENKDIPIYIFLRKMEYHGGEWIDTGVEDYIITFIKSAGYTPSPTQTSTPTPTPEPQITISPTPEQRAPYVPSFNECQVKGLENPILFSPGVLHSFQAIGVSAESLFEDHVIGDGKWVPEFWSSDSSGIEHNEKWELGGEQGYSTGTFDLFVWFRLYKWDGTTWSSTSDLRYLKTQFTSLPNATATPTPSPSAIPTITPIITPTIIPTTIPTITPIVTVTATPVPTATPTNTPIPTATPIPTSIPVPAETKEAPVITGFYNSVRGADLRWSKCEGCSGYCVYRKRAADGIKVVTFINDPNITQCYDTDIQNDCWGRVYVYYVSAVYANGYEPESNQVTLQRLAPMKFSSYKNNSESAVDLAWACTVNANKALGYEVQYATTKTDLFNRTGSFKKVSVNGRNNLKLKISGLTKGQTYYFRIRCYVNYTHSVTKKTTKTWSQYSDVVSVKITR